MIKKTNKSAVYEPVLMVDLFWDQAVPLHDQGVQWIIDLTLGLDQVSSDLTRWGIYGSSRIQITIYFF